MYVDRQKWEFFSVLSKVFLCSLPCTCTNIFFFCQLQFPGVCLYSGNTWALCLSSLAAWLQVVPSGRSDVGLSERGSEMVQKENVSECLVGLCVFCWNINSISWKLKIFAQVHEREWKTVIQWSLFNKISNLIYTWNRIHTFCSRTDTRLYSFFSVCVYTGFLFIFTHTHTFFSWSCCWLCGSQDTPVQNESVFVQDDNTGQRDGCGLRWREGEVGVVCGIERWEWNGWVKCWHWVSIVSVLPHCLLLQFYTFTCSHGFWI